MMTQISGVVVGIVQNLEDPEELGRVKVHFPWMSEGNQSHWARIATLMAGPQRGSWFMPEIDDEVLVSFDHGNIQHPFIVGFLWNGVDRPPNEGINRSVRRLQTVSGHVVEFDDNPGQERVFITTQGGQQVELKDTPTAQIMVKTQGGQEVTLSDVPASITVKTSSGNEITISDLPPGISLSTQTGQLTVNCLQANVTASAMLNITAPITVFSGIVQIPTLVAQSVVGTAYTPAPGNTFGL